MALTAPATPLPIPTDIENKFYYDELINIFSIIKTKENIHLGSIGTSEIINIDGKINIKAPEHISVTGGVNIKDPHTIEVTGDCHSGFRKCDECGKMFPTTDTDNNTYCCGCAFNLAIYGSPASGIPPTFDKYTKRLYYYNNRNNLYGKNGINIPQNIQRTQVFKNSWTPEHNKFLTSLNPTMGAARTSNHPAKNRINYVQVDMQTNGQYPCTLNNYDSITYDATGKKVVQSGGSRNKKSDNNKLKNKKSGNIHTKKGQQKLNIIEPKEEELIY